MSVMEQMGDLSAYRPGRECLTYPTLKEPCVLSSQPSDARRDRDTAARHASWR